MGAEQAGLVYYIDPQYIATPNTFEGLRLFKNLLDGQWYVKKPDGTLELFASSLPFNVSETTIDITGVTVIDMTGSEDFGIINLTSANPAETVVKIINTTQNRVYTFRPEVGLIVTFQDKSLGVAGDNLKLANGELFIDGTNHGYMNLQRRTVGAVTDFYSLDYLDVYA